MKTKKKISISIDRLLLEDLDKMIDGKIVKNRSQAVEKLIREQTNKEEITRAIILAGGGRRAYHNGMLKCMRTIRRIPIIVHTIRRLNDAGIFDIVISTSEKRRIEKVLSRYGLTASFEPDPKIGTAGIVKRLMKGRTMVVSGDVYFELNLKRMIAAHIHSKSLATMLITTTTMEKSKDAIAVEGNIVTKFSYKPKTRSYLVNAGVYIFEHEIVNLLPSRGSLESKLFPVLASSGRLSAFHFSGRWFHVD